MSEQAQPLEVTKLITIIEEAHQEVRTEITRNHFEGYDDEAMKTIVVNLLQTGASRIHLEVDRLKEDTPEAFTPVNPGSLYDEIVFETSIYGSNDGQVLVNTSFGRLANPQMPLIASIEHVAEVLTFVSERFMDADLSELPAS